MTNLPEKKVRQMPKGGRKGGSVFPRVALSDAVTYARRLVSKTHTSPQPEDVLRSGVFGAKGSTGAVRMSALKQYGFLKGDAKTNYSADTLAKKISAAPPDELIPLYREAILKPTIFKKLFDTFHGDTVSKAKLKQRAADLKVHPDEAATCVELYVGGMTTARLVTVNGDQIKHVASVDIATAPDVAEIDSAGIENTSENCEERERSEVKETIDTVDYEKPKDEVIATAPKSLPTDSLTVNGPRAVFNVNVTLDSSLDIDKLQKQLDLLKKFGAI